MSWPLVKLGDIFDISSSKRVHQKDWREKGVPFYRAREVVMLSRDGKVDNELFIDEVMYEEYKSKFGVPQEGDLLVTAVGTLGQTYAVKSNDRFYFKDASVIWLSKKAEVDTSYIQHALATPGVQRFIQNSSGATVGTYTISKAKDTKVPLPPLDEQKRIAAILDKADALRRKRQQAIDLADQFLRSVFLEMFGDPVTNPKGWDDLPLSDLILSPLQNGAYYPKDLYVSTGVEMVHMSDAFYDVIKRGALKRVAATAKDIEKYALAESDVLISRRSLNLEGAAKPSLIPRAEEPLIFESSMIRVTPNQDKLLPRYLFAFLGHPLVKAARVSKYVTGATIKGISQSNLAKVKVLVPPVNIQKDFVRIMEWIESLKEKWLKSESEIDLAFSAISQKAFRGDL